MTLLQRVVVEKRWAITVVLVSVVIDMVLYGLAVLPWSVALANAQQRAVPAPAAVTVSNGSDGQ